MKRFFLNILLLIIPALIYGCEDNDEKGLIPPPPASEERPEWELVFEENFDGSEIDESKWLIYDYPGHANNGLRSPEAVSVENGLFVITARMKGDVLYSGAVAHRENYLYGKFEFRVRTDADPSGAMSAVVLTWPQDEKWPDSGENDIYETHSAPNQERNYFTSNILSGLPLNKWSNKKYDMDAKEWHIVAMEWQESVIRIYIDGVLRWRLTNPKDFVHKPHHLCIQLDAFEKSMTGETKMYVDWVKIYQEKKQ